MRIALVDSNPKPKVYPLPLLKIGAWKKANDDYCQLFNNSLPKPGEFDEIWITTTFTYDVPHAIKIIREAKKRAKKVLVGGISASLMPERFEKEGVEVHKGLILEAEKCSPDYSLLESPTEYSITHTSRGCIRKCSFCMVKTLEPEFKNREKWERDISPATKKVLFYDNNFLAKSLPDLKKDIETLKKLVRSGKVLGIDFNQGLDARLMTEEIGDILKGLPINPVRFAFDGLHEDGYFQNAVKIMAERGFVDFMNYVLYNFTDTPKDLYYRVRTCVELSEEFGVRCQVFPMRYQPILIPSTDRGYVGKNWTQKKRNNFSSIVSSHGSGKISCKGVPGIMGMVEEFEYWFGKSPEEFDRLLSYPKLRELLNRKKGSLRIRRATKRLEEKGKKNG